MYLAESSTNIPQFPLSTLYGDAGYGVVCRPVPVGALFAPTVGLHFYAPHPHSFFFICTLPWCKHCTWGLVAPNLRKFPLTALYGAAEHGAVYRPVPVDALFAPTQGIHF